MTMNMRTAGVAEVRDFLRLCLEPRPGQTRPPEALAKILPGPLRDNLHVHAPHLAALHRAAEEAAAEAARTAAAYADALRRWIVEESDPAVPTAGAVDSVSPGRCPQNSRGDDATPQLHVFPTGGGVARCLFCNLPAGDVPAAYRTPDERVWTLAAATLDDGTPLYEAPFVGTQYTYGGLFGLFGSVYAVREVAAPPYVYNADSVNRRPGTAAKHIPDGRGSTICPRGFRATDPMPAEIAARLPLCRGCRDAALTAAGLPTA